MNVSEYPPRTLIHYPLQAVLEVACAAQRENGEYLKESKVTVDPDTYTVMFVKYPNKLMIIQTLEPGTFADSAHPIPMLKVTQEDRDLAERIIKYYKRLMFAAMVGNNSFHTDLNAILSAPTITRNNFGFVACLPSVYERDHTRWTIDKKLRSAEDGFLGDVGTTLLDKDAEIIAIYPSKEYQGWNVIALVENKRASWFTNKELTPGPCVIVSAKVKGHGKDFKHELDTTRLNYVKAAQ